MQIHIQQNNQLSHSSRASPGSKKYCSFQNTAFYFSDIITWLTDSTCHFDYTDQKSITTFICGGVIIFYPTFIRQKALKVRISRFMKERGWKEKKSPLSINKCCDVCARLRLSPFNLAVHSFTLWTVTNWKTNDLWVINVESGNTHWAALSVNVCVCSVLL